MKIGISSFRRVVCFALMCAATVSDVRAAPESVRIPVTKDVWVSSYGKEVVHSMGRTKRLKLKGREECALMGFDASGLKGRRIVSVALFCRNAAAEENVARVGPEGRADTLRYIGV